MQLHPKVATAGLAGAVVTILLWVLHIATSIDPPPEVVAALTLVVMSATGWFTPAP